VPGVNRLLDVFLRWLADKGIDTKRVTYLEASFIAGRWKSTTSR
jgi:hypothetical protein